MANKLLLNNKARNHIKVLPLKDFVAPEDEGERIKWCEKTFEDLKNSEDAKRLLLSKDRKKGILIAVWQLNDVFYLIQSMRNEFSSYNNVIYLTKNKDDATNIAKFLIQNHRTIMNDYKKQILDAKDMKISKDDKVNESN